MEKVLAFGHKNPDTDSICSALAVADLHREMGYNIEAVRLGAINEETAFALKEFQIEAPRFVEHVAAEAKYVVLVDHNEPAQSASDIEQLSVIAVVDHHRIAGFETAEPIYFRCEPVGCTATILLKMYKENNVTIKPEVAGLLLSAIISDTLLLKSPTCTEQDVKAYHELAQLAGLKNPETYGLAMLKAGATLVGKTAEEIMNVDSKPFVMGGKKLEIAQVNVVDLTDGLEMRTALEKAMDDARKEKNQDIFLLLITDILNNDSIALVSGDISTVEKAFAVQAQDGIINLPGVVSRKKQVVPVLEKTLS